MKISTFTSLAFLLLAQTIFAGWTVYKESYFRASGCKSALDSTATFCKKSSAKTYVCICSSDNGLASWANCAYNVTSPYDEGITNEMITLCADTATPITADQIHSLYDSSKNNITSIETISGYNKTTDVVDVPVTSKKLHTLYLDNYKGLKNRWGNVNTSHYLGIAFVSATGLFLIVCGIINWTIRLFPGFTNSCTGSFINFLRKNFILAPLFKNKHLEPNAFGINPDRFEAVMIFIMFLYSLLSCCIIGSKYWYGDTTFATYQAGTSRYWGDRSCILLSYQIPFLFLFPGRNNFFQWVTRWKYSRFVTFHKWLARIILMEILIHAFAMSSQTYALAKFTRFATGWYREGITAAVAAFCSALVASYTIRSRWYEFFLYSHIVLVAMFLWTAWRHAYSQGYQNYYWACCAIWIFDRVVRIMRIILSGGVKTANLQYFEDDGVLKLIVPKTAVMKQYPGSHAFIYFLTPSTFMQSHCFTAVETDCGEIHFFCRVKKGITRRMANKLRNLDNKTSDFKILIEGFYGEQTPYQNYDKVVLFAAGTGVSGPLAHAKKLLQSDSSKELRFYWSIRHYAALEWVKSDLMAFKNSKVSPIIYISDPNSINVSNGSNGSNGNTSSEEKSIENNENNENNEKLTDEKSITEVFDFVEFRAGRIDAGEIVTQELNDSNGSIAFGTCAHPIFVDSVRVAVKNRLNSHPKRVDYFEEMQAW